MSGAGVSLSFPACSTTPFSLPARGHPQATKALWGSVQMFRSSFIELAHKCRNTAQETSIDLVPLSYIKKVFKKIIFWRLWEFRRCFQIPALRQDRHRQRRCDVLVATLSKFRVTGRLFSEEKPQPFTPSNSLHFSLIIPHTPLKSCHHAAPSV